MFAYVGLPPAARSSGPAQVPMNQALREYLGKIERHVDEKILRRVLREVLVSE